MVATGRTRDGLPGWLARRRYGARLKRRIAAKLGTAPTPPGEAPPPGLPRPTPAGFAGNVVPLRRPAPPTGAVPSQS